MADVWKNLYQVLSVGTKEMQSFVSNIKKLIDEAPDEIPGDDSRSRIFRKICEIIPGKIDNALVVYAFELMRKEQHLHGKQYNHYKKNEENFDKHKPAILKNKGFVEDQNNYQDMRYGSSNMQYSGCEVLATYNALNHLWEDREISLAGLIREFEQDGMVLSGKFGTSPKAIQDRLRYHGLKTVFSTKEAEFEGIAAKYDSLILTMYNDREDLSKEVHTIYISKDRMGYTAHNVYGNGSLVGPHKTLRDLLHHINQGKVKGISVIGIRRPSSR